MPPVPRRPHRRLAAAASAAVLAALLTAPPGAAAAPPGPLAGASSAAPAAAAVTLVTGDRVLVSYAADGTASAMLRGDGDYYTRRDGEDLYVIPVAAEAALAAGRLDPELFNVTGLVRQGYDDASTPTLPLIVTGAAPRTRSLTGLAVGEHLESIGATAVSADKDALADTYASLLGDPAARSAGPAKIWLDGKVEGFGLDPATGVEQTGAPEAWELGYDGEGTRVAVLDTGYDARHPDLAGRVVAARDFTGAGDPADRAGHGTHVASTIAGTGAADPSRVGMAPGADLLIGRVLGVGGGQASWIIAGMEWAVEQNADVVNMSLGSDTVTDCTDPMAQAAQALSEQSRTLFVVAAGNSGMRETVSSPGCAAGVLTVGAVDADGATANFSSRGPVVGDHRVKPDIAAPGVAIVGAANGSPGGIHYTAMSGTSMATPHVVGAAALVRQAHPDWTAQQVKAALVASVKEDPQGTVYEQGAGELWVPGAIAAGVVSTPSVHIATYDWPHGRDEETTGHVTYTNHTGEDVTLGLRLTDATGADGRSVPGRAFRLEDHRVTVPAHGTAEVGVTVRGDVHLREDAYGEIGARVVATGRDGLRVTTAVGYWAEPETVTVTFEAVGRDGAPATSGYLDITDMQRPARSAVYFTGEDITLRLRAGEYVVTGIIGGTEADGTRSYTYVGDPEAHYDEDRTVTLDARDAEPIEVETDRPARIRSGSLHIGRSFDGWLVDGSVFAGNDPRFYAAPTRRVHDGDFAFGAYLRLYDPAVAEEDSDYVYNLAFTGDRVPSDPTYRVDDEDLAAVTEHWHAQRDATVLYDWTAVPQDNGGDPIFAGSIGRVAAPSDRTAYYTPGTPWRQYAASSKFFTETWVDPVRTYDRGERGETDWYRMPVNTGMFVQPDGTPARVAERQGTLVGFAFPSWQDTVTGRYGIGGFGDVGNLRIRCGDELLLESAWPSGQADVGAEPCDLTVTVNQLAFAKGDNWDIGRGTRTTFRFRTERPEGDAVAALPVALPDYDAPVDAYNLAPNTSTAFPVAVTLQGQDGYDPGGITEFHAKVTFDELTAFEPYEDANWTDVPVAQRDGTWYALVDNTVAPGGHASLWITTVDAHGTTTEQITSALYGVA